MSKILLIEPDYKNKYPPLGLMKISYFHKYILHDYVRFAKGKLPAAFDNTKWDRIYVTSLFTFEWKKTIKAINYAKTLVDDISKITVGGIAATLLPDQIYEETGIHPVCGLLNEPGKLGLPGDECIDQIIPDYDILDDIDYIYPFHDAYFLSATKGCGMKCGFCAVQTLESTYIPYMDIKEKIAAIDEKFGQKKDLLLMDNNVLRSNHFDQIIDDIIEAGFGKGANYINPKTKKTVRRYVDFNQGLDGNLFTEAKAKRLGDIALRPARVAFDHIEDKETYEKALRLCAKNGITELSNYVLYNSEDFGGKGKKYHADTPEDLYDRMRITLDLKDEINRTLPKGQHVAAYSFPMRYIPLNAHERGYVGSMWNAKFLRAVQCMLIPTQGKGVGNKDFFEADFGKSSKEFLRFLCMPDKLIAARGHFKEGGRGRTKETLEELKNRKANWKKNQKKIKEWNRLYNKLGDDLQSFISLIGDNEFLPEKVLGISSDTQKKLYLSYLTMPRLVTLLGMINHNSPTYPMLYNYIKKEFKEFYFDILEYVTCNESQPLYVFKSFADFFGKEGVVDILKILSKENYSKDRLLKKWNEVSKKNDIDYVDFELIRIYRRFVDLKTLSCEEQQVARYAIENTDMSGLAYILNEHFSEFETQILAAMNSELGQKILKEATKVIVKNIQMKLSQFLRS